MKFGDLGDDESMQVYLPASQSRTTGGIIVRTLGDPRSECARWAYASR